MKKIIALILTAVLLLSATVCGVSAASGQTAPQLKVKSTSISYTGKTSDTFGVAVGLTLGGSHSGFSTYVMTVTWDPAALQLVTDGTEDGCWFSDHFGMGLTMIEDTGHSVNLTRVSSGSLTVASGSASNRKKTTGTLFVLAFRPLNKNADLTSVTVSFGSPTVAAKDALSSEKGAITGMESEAFLCLSLNGGSKLPKGDVNSSGSVEAFDYQMLKASVLGSYKLSPVEKAHADVNEDLAIDAFDYMMVKSIVLGTLKY